MPPTQLSQPVHQAVKQHDGVGVAAIGSARRVGHVVLPAVAEQRRAAAPGVRPRQPVRPRLTGAPRPDLLAAPDEFLQRERPRPGRGLGGHGVPQMFPGHGQDQSGLGQVGRAGDPAAVRADLDAAFTHDRDDLRRRRVAGPVHPGRPHRLGHAKPGQPPREQRGRHRGPAHVSGAQHQDATHRGIVWLCLRWNSMHYLYDISFRSERNTR